MHLKRKSASELGAGISGTADNIGFINLVEWIRSERLHTLPHKGSRWDTVLIRALYFAERLHGFEMALKGQAVDAEQAAQLGYGHVKVLLEVSANEMFVINTLLTFSSSATRTARLSTKRLASCTAALPLFRPYLRAPRCFHFLQRSTSSSA